MSKLTDLDLRALSQIESHIMKEQVTTPYVNKDWYIYFNHSVIGFHFFTVFLTNYGRGDGTRFNDLLGDWKLSGLRGEPYSRDAIKKKLLEGVDTGVLKRYTDDADARVAIYQISGEHKEDLARHIMHIQQNRVRALMDGNNHMTRNLMNLWKKFFSERFGIPVNNEVLDMFLTNGK